MKNHYSISIPKPCHENWNIMTPKEKGRFCDSCTKTVIDFTKMKNYEIQDFIHENKNNRICGHFKQSQLDSINLHIPSQILIQQKSFHKLFLLVLLIAMGTTLLNCTNKNGGKQKIDSIEIIDKENNDVIDVTFGLPTLKETDSIIDKTTTILKSNPKKMTPPPTPELTGVMITEILGDVVVEEPPIEKNSLKPIDPSWCPVPTKEFEEENFVFGFIQVETPPEFKNTPKNLSINEKQKYFSKKITDLISNYFNTSTCLSLKGKQRIHTRFEIDTLGFVKNIKVRAPHPKLEEEAKRVLKLLPQFIPAKHEDKPTNISYNLPIVFQIEE